MSDEMPPEVAAEILQTHVLVPKKAISDMEQLVKTQCSSGNWNCNSYMHGMANGMILMLATLNNEEPEYLKKPKEGWLDDRPRDPSFSMNAVASDTSESQEPELPRNMPSF